MKNFELKNTNEVVISVEITHPKKIQHIAKIMPHHGHKLWELNVESGEIVMAKINVTEPSINAGRVALMSKVIVRDGCLYAMALNLKNARKHFDKFFKNK